MNARRRNPQEEFGSMNETRKAILVVSFGTSFPETRKKTIGAIEQKMRNAFPDLAFYSAWTSKKIIAKLKRTTGEVIDTVDEALARMKNDGVSEVLIQPTHIASGIENDLMKEAALSGKDAFDRLSFGMPLMTSDRDMEYVTNALAEVYGHLSEEEALVLMGHGTTHFANMLYAALDYRFKDMGHPSWYVGTVEGYPDLDCVRRMLAKKRPSKIILAPFMIVAGDHATNDMAGDDEDSWKSILQKDGYAVEARLVGLGEYPAIQELLIRHAREALA